MKDDVALIDQLSRDRLVMNALNGVVETRMILQMADVFDAASGKIIDDKYFVAALQARRIRK